MRLNTTPAPRRRLTDEQAAEIQREYRKPGVTTAYLGQKYGVSQQTAHMVATGRRYGHLPTAPRPGERPKWQDPAVCTKGLPSPEDMAVLVRMLKANPGREALIKKTIRRTPVDCLEALGLSVESRRVGRGWGIYVSWPLESLAVA